MSVAIVFKKIVENPTVQKIIVIVANEIVRVFVKKLQKPKEKSGR